MAKKTDKKSKPAATAKAEIPANPVAPADPEVSTNPAIPNPTAIVNPESPVKSTAAAKPEASKKPAAPAKRAVKPAVKAKAAPGKAKTVAKVTSVKAPSYTRDDIALRAYFIAEKRQSLGLSGDEHQDWIEAERQLASESARPRKSSKA